MVKNRLAQPDAQQNGWLLDGYPRSESQGRALEAAGIHPELFILLEVRATVCASSFAAAAHPSSASRRSRMMCWWSG